MGVSRRGGDFIMGVISYIVGITFQRRNQAQGHSMAPAEQNIFNQFPSTITSALSKFHLDGQVTVYAVCPKCHCTYEPQLKKGSATATYPAKCANVRKLPKSSGGAGLCNELLCQSGPDGSILTSTPLKTFVYHSFHDYLAGLLSRSDLETTMDQVCDDFMESRNQPNATFIKNAFDADFLKTFKGPDGERLFLDRGDEGRYIFTLNIDFFNPEGMNIRGPSTSCGIISMACLNIPVDQRYKPENMYLAGIIPGPVEPHNQELNHYIRPLMTDMEISWRRGIHISRTAMAHSGRTTRSAIIAGVCDLPAARKASQLASHGAHFYCSVCQCKHLSTRGRTDVNHPDWSSPDNHLRRHHAERSRDAATWEEQEKIFAEHGVRWSELWVLPYWNPSRQLVVDSMHCILEGLVQHHSRDVLGLTKTAAHAKIDVIPAFRWTFKTADPSIDPDRLTEREMKQISKIHLLLTAPVNQEDSTQEHLDKLHKALFGKNHKALAFVCNDLDHLPGGRKVSKSQMATALVNWASSFHSTYPKPNCDTIVPSDNSSH